MYCFRNTYKDLGLLLCLFIAGPTNRYVAELRQTSINILQNRRGAAMQLIFESVTSASYTEKT